MCNVYYRLILDVSQPTSRNRMKITFDIDAYLKLQKTKKEKKNLHTFSIRFLAMVFFRVQNSEKRKLNQRDLFILTISSISQCIDK